MALRMRADVLNILSVFPCLGFVDSDLDYRLYDMYDHLPN